MKRNLRSKIVKFGNSRTKIQFKPSFRNINIIFFMFLYILGKIKIRNVLTN